MTARDYYPGVYSGSPCSPSYLGCYWGQDSTVIPARGKYSLRFTDYAGVLQPDPGQLVNGFRLGSGQPGEDGVQHGVQVQLLPSGGDAKQNLVRVGYAAPAAGPNLEISQEYPDNLLVGSMSYYAFTVANIGLGPTTGQITVHDYLPNGISFVSAGGGGWTCSAEDSLVTCLRSNPMQPGERSRLELNIKVDRKTANWAPNEMEVVTTGDTSTKNNGTIEYSAVVSARTLYFPQVADGAIPGGKFQTTFVLVNTGMETPIQLEVYDSNGHEMLVNVDSLGSASRVSTSLYTGESYTFQTRGQGSLRVGYAKLIAPETVNGTAVFSFTENNVTLYEAGVPGVSPSSEFSVVMNSIPNIRQTGLALVNTGTRNATATLRLYDKAFNLKASKTLADLVTDHVFQPGDHLALFALEIFPEIASLDLQEGSITVESDVPLAALTLRLNDKPGKILPEDVMNLSAFPVVQGRAERTRTAGASGTFYFGQFADGAGAGLKFQTSLFFLNTNEASSVKVEFFNPRGAPSRHAWPARPSRYRA